MKKFISLLISSVAVLSHSPVYSQNFIDSLNNLKKATENLQEQIKRSASPSTSSSDTKSPAVNQNAISSQKGQVGIDEYMNVVLGRDCKSSTAGAYVYVENKGIPTERVYVLNSKLVYRDIINEFKNEGGGSFLVNSKDSKGRNLSDVISFKNGKVQFVKRELDGVPFVLDGSNIKNGAKTSINSICPNGSPLFLAVQAAFNEEGRMKRDSENELKEKEKENRKTESEAKAQQAKDERLLYFKTLEGQRDFDNFQKTLSQILKKPIANDCTDPGSIVSIFDGDKSSITKILNFSEEKEVSEEVVEKFEYLGNDLVLIESRDSDGVSRLEYKINPKYIQIYNGLGVKNGINRSGNQTPLNNICPANSVAAKIVDNELNGNFIKIRAQKREDALINISGNINMDKLPSNLVQKVCGEVKGLSRATPIESVLMLKNYPLIEIAKNGGYSYGDAYLAKNGKCYFEISVVGMNKGNSYNSKMACRIWQVVKANQGGYLATGVGGAVDYCQ